MLLHATSIIFDACSQTSNFAQLLKIIRTKIVAKQIIWKTLKILKSKCFPISTKLIKYGLWIVFFKKVQKATIIFFSTFNPRKYYSAKFHCNSVC